MKSYTKYGVKVLHIIRIGNIVTISADGIIYILPSCIGHVLLQAC